MKATTTTLEDGAPSLRRSADFVARHPALTPGPSPDSCLAGEGRSSSASSRLLFGRSPWRLPRLATRWVAMACAVALLGLFAFDARNARSALAEGEAGVVIQHGDGSTETFCVAFTGDSISGDQLLKRAGVAQENVNGLVCSVGQRADEGCYGAGTFESCTCKCKNPGAGCAYWAFYTQRYGQQWVYSALGFLAQRAKDGEMQAWRWGLGGANSAPAPAAISFEQVCGHSPRGGIAPATNTALPPTIVAATPAPNTVALATIAPATAAAPSAGITITAAASVAGSTPLGETGTPKPDVIINTVVPSVATSSTPAPASNVSGSKDDGGRGGTIVFGLVAGGLGAMIAGAFVWKQRRGR